MFKFCLSLAPAVLPPTTGAIARGAHKLPIGATGDGASASACCAARVEESISGETSEEHVFLGVSRSGSGQRSADLSI